MWQSLLGGTWRSLVVGSIRTSPFKGFTKTHDLAFSTSYLVKPNKLQKIYLCS
ncbi:unnamed protein product [Prunus brigantina]